MLTMVVKVAFIWPRKWDVGISFWAVLATVACGSGQPSLQEERSHLPASHWNSFPSTAFDSMAMHTRKQEIKIAERGRGVRSGWRMMHQSALLLGIVFAALTSVFLVMMCHRQLLGSKGASTRTRKMEAREDDMLPLCSVG